MNNTELLIDKIIKGMQEKKAHQLVVVDLKSIEDTICKAFVICTGNSPTHIQALADSIEETVRKEAGEKPMAIAGLRMNGFSVDWANVQIHQETLKGG